MCFIYINISIIEEKFNLKDFHLILSHRNDRFGAAHMTYHRDVYSDPMRRSHSSKSKNTSVTTSALTLLAFLFFINILQSCLKEQMVSMNPTVRLLIFKQNNYKSNWVHLIFVQGYGYVSWQRQHSKNRPNTE